MEPTSKNIIVPWDFTIVAEYALQHAVLFAKKIKAKIYILHIVKKEGEIQGAREQIDKITSENQKETGVVTETLVAEGSIFNTISMTAKEKESEMVVMGTHGIKGMQKYLGSYAIKVIANTFVPFVVVQDAPRENLFNNILLPINFRRENKEILNWIIHFCKFFEMNVHIFAARYRDRKLKKSVSSNILFAKKILEKKKIPFDFNWSPSRRDFPKEVIKHAKEINPDMILVMTTRDLTLADFLIGANEQYIIANTEKIPVMCLSPRPIKNTGGFMAGGG